jgi:hypothetical protein
MRFFTASVWMEMCSGGRGDCNGGGDVIGIIGKSLGECDIRRVCPI